MPASAWVGGVCQEVEDFYENVRRGAQELESDRDQGYRDFLSSWVAALLEETDQTIRRMEALGIPDVEGGEKVANDILDQLQGVRDDLRSAQEMTEDLPDDQQTRETERIRETIVAALDGVVELLGALAGSPELVSVYEQVEECPPSLGPAS